MWLPDGQHGFIHWELLAVQNLEPHPDSQNQNLLFNKIPRGFLDTVNLGTPAFLAMLPLLASQRNLLEW